MLRSRIRACEFDGMKKLEALGPKFRFEAESGWRLCRSRPATGKAAPYEVHPGTVLVPGTGGIVEVLAAVQA